MIWDTRQQLYLDAYKDSYIYYAPGWEAAGLSENPELGRGDYRPRNRKCHIGAVNLTQTGWPGTCDYEPWRGAVPVPPVSGHKGESDRAPKVRRDRH